MNTFIYARPGTLEEAVSLFSQYGRRASLLAGGTDLLVRMRHGRSAPEIVIDLKRVNGLSSEIAPVGSSLRVGALAVMADLIEDEQVRRSFPALVEAAGTVGSVQIRNRATLAGNLCNASPAADTAPALLVYGAVANLVGPGGRRIVPVHDFYLGPGETVLQEGELVESIDLPLPRGKVGAAFARLTRRRGVDLATVSVCCLVSPPATARFGFGAVAPRPLLVTDESGVFLNPTAEAGAADRVLKQLAARASPISDVRARQEYRQAMLLVMSRRALQAALKNLETLDQ